MRIRRSLKRLAELRRGRVDRLELRALAGQQGDEVGEGRDQPLGLLAELGPQDSVEIGVLDVGVVGERLGERRLAVAAGAAQRRGDAGDGIAFGVEQALLERVELFRAGDEVLRRRRRHHRHAPRLGVPLQLGDKRCLLLGKVEIVDMAEPARQLVEVDDARPLDRADRLALLPGEADFLLARRALSSAAGVTTRMKCWRSFDLSASLDLAPPVLAALERNEVLPDGEVFLFELSREARARTPRRPCANRR